MSLLSRSARVAARCSRSPHICQPRRLDSHHAGHGNSESAFHVSGGSGNESLGASFYIGISLIPISIVAYSIAASSDKPILTRLIDAYTPHEDEVNRVNDLEAAAISQAAADRIFFATVPLNRSGPELKYPEQFNSSSPWNVVAGQGTADLQELSQYMAEKEKKIEQARISRMKDGKVVTVYDDTTGGRFPNWMPLVGKKEGR